MRKFTKTSFPIKWAVRAITAKEDSILVDYYNKKYNIELSKGIQGQIKGWWFYSEEVKHVNMSDYSYYNPGDIALLKGFEEISFEEFEYYVLNEQFFKKTKESNKELIKLLKNIT